MLHTHQHTRTHTCMIRDPWRQVCRWQVRTPGFGNGSVLMDLLSDSLLGFSQKQAKHSKEGMSFKSPVSPLSLPLLRSFHSFYNKDWMWINVLINRYLYRYENIILLPLSSYSTLGSRTLGQFFSIFSAVFWLFLYTIIWNNKMVIIIFLGGWVLCKCNIFNFTWCH